MKTKIRTAKVVFLVLLGLLGGCSHKQEQWEYLYQTEADVQPDDTVHSAESADQQDSLSESSISESSKSEVLHDAEDSEKQEEQDSDKYKDTIYVYVCGAVTCPGVYELETGSRVHHAIAAAGGLTQDADLFLVNQARVLEDGEQIRIYTGEEAKEVSSTEIQKSEIAISEEAAKQDKIDINHATSQQLMTLPGIGEAKAAAIIEYRETRGAFQTIEDLMKIPGIKQAVFSKIKDQITV